MLVGNQLNQLNSMYPSMGLMLNKQTFNFPDYAKYCSVYGYSFGRAMLEIDGKKYDLESNQYFGLKVLEKGAVLFCEKLFLVIRLGYLVPNSIGWVENKGRLSYIDGCSDSLLVYPARMGDSSLNVLFFPPGIEQTYHTHPSIRMGCVIDGQGISDSGELGQTIEHELTKETAFCLIEHERHRFRTTVKSSMTVIAFHPDGDWGPTDHNHTMLNRTYINK